MNERTAIQAAVRQLVEGNDLSREQAREVMTEIMEGRATPAQIGSLLTSLRIKGETIDEITGFAEAMRNKSERVQVNGEGLLDTCGTGGSGISKFNISTTSALIASAEGARVAKHGNRAMSGRSGSADVLEALGVNISLTGEMASKCLEQVGICFMFAQLYHPSMKYAAGPRKELGFRTVFNLLGPLTNPAGADRQLLGVFDRGKTDTIAHVLKQLGLKRALVVSSYDGLDEISISAPTRISELIDGEIRSYDLSPEDIGLKRYKLEEVMGGDPRENAEIIIRVLQGEQSAYRDIVLANAGACIYVSGLSASMREGVERAAESIDSGRAYAKLQQLIHMTGELAHVS
jgi:anthranilate phosphoribosyltransferase